mgnify:CR=1 FL=1
MLKPSRYLEHHPDFYKESRPEELLTQPELVVFNEKLAFQLELDQLKDRALVLSGQKLLQKPIALNYAGHQFGHFVPQLGDGRAHLLGEVSGKNGENFDLQLKGSGRTPYSRGGDGKSPLGPALREFLISEAIHYLGIPTTRSLSVVATGETVYRQEELSGAIVSRLAKAHIRVGSFEYFAARNQPEQLKELIQILKERLYPQIESVTDLYFEILKNQASLIAKWMSVGFIHGVMNTDNMSLAGQTIDFGPCAFMDQFNSKQVFSSIDRHARYAYNQQASIAHWNLSVLAGCFVLVIDASEHKKLEEYLNQWDEEFNKALCLEFSLKFGLSKNNTIDLEFIHHWWTYLEKHQLDFTTAHRELATLLVNGQHSYFIQDKDFEKWYGIWQDLISKEDRPKNLIQIEMNTTNPIIIPRNHIVEKALSEANEGNLELFIALWEAIQTPFQKDTTREEFLIPPTEDEKITATFCGT